MKKTITIIVLSFFSLSNLFCQQNYDIVDNIQWEALDGPTGFVTGFAKSGNRLFAKPHFYSDDMGESWHKLPDFFEPEQIIATDETVLVHETIVNSYHIAGNASTGENRTEQIYCSNDNGQNFQKSVNTYNFKGYRSDGQLSNIVSKNEKTFCFSKYNYGLGVVSGLYYTSDRGESWDSTKLYYLAPNLFSANDTVVAVCAWQKNVGGPNVVFVFGSDDFSNPRIDTLPEGVGTLYVDGLYYVFKQDTILTYNPKTKSLIEYPSNHPVGHAKYIDGLFYFSSYEGVFSFDLKDPTLIDTLYISPSPQGSFIPFGVFDDIWLVFDDGDIQRSLDKGITWERKYRGITNVSGTMELIDDRFCLNNAIYSSPTVDFWSSDNPPTGTPQGNGNVSGQIFTYGDTLVKFEGQTRLESIDNGITWDSLHFSQVGFGTLFENRDTFVSYGSNTFSSSFDRGKTWTKHPHYIRSSWIIGNHTEYRKIHGMYNGLLILDGVFMSRDYGESWSGIANLPFGREIGYIGTLRDYFLPGAKRYFYKDNYLYAFQDGYGLWRTPYDELEKALRGIVDGSDLELTMTSNDTEPENWTNFSVEVTIENTGTLPNDNIIVHVPEPDEVVYQGRNEYQTTKGHFEFWQIQEWKVGSLDPGESATLTLNYFRKSEKPFNYFAQVIEASEPDLDSEPNNGSCCNITEDDEAVLEFGEAPRIIWRRNFNSQSADNQLFERVNLTNSHEQQIAVIAYPNPFNTELNFKFQSAQQGVGQIQIFDVLGRFVLEKSIQLINGENLKTINTDKLPTGILTAKISNSENEFQRIQILKNR